MKAIDENPNHVICICKVLSYFGKKYRYEKNLMSIIQVQKHKNTLLAIFYCHFFKSYSKPLKTHQACLISLHHYKVKKCISSRIYMWPHFSFFFLEGTGEHRCLEKSFIHLNQMLVEELQTNIDQTGITG